MRVVSALPGRVRWHVPPLLNAPILARRVSSVLAADTAIRSVSASHLTGNILTTFDPHLLLDDARATVERAVRAAHDWPDDRAEPSVPALPSVPAPLARLFEHAAPHRPLVKKMLAASFFNHLLDASPPVLVGAGLDIVTRGRSSLIAWLGLKSVPGQLFALGGLGLAVWAADAILDYHQRSSSAELASVVRDDLRNQLYQHIQRLDLAQIEAREVNSWLNLLEGDLARVHGFIKDASDPIATIAANGVAVAVSLLTLSPSFALAQVLLVPPVLMASRQLLEPLKARLVASQRRADQLSALLHGNVSSLSTIKSFASQDDEASRVAAAGREQVTSAHEANELSARYVPTLTAIVGTGFMSTLVYGGLKLHSGTIAPGAYNVVANTQLRMLAAIAYFGTSLEHYQRTALSLTRVFTVLDLKPAIAHDDRGVPFSGLTRDVVFDNVTFGYEPDRSVLSNLHLRFPAGSTTGIVGLSGAGKSTLLKLLLRFYDVGRGSIRFDDVDVRELRLEDVRRSVAMVSQEAALFAGTVRDNIVYARRDANDAEVERAARIAEAHDFISRLPDGYDTQIGFGGHTLSGGQRQRLAIARVVLADRPVLLFDEATSSLDFETEASVQRSLDEFARGRTSIIVAHRLSTVRRADRIYVLDQGRLREEGTHDSLVEADGIYASMWRVQTGESLRRR